MEVNSKDSSHIKNNGLHINTNELQDGNSLSILGNKTSYELANQNVESFTIHGSSSDKSNLVIPAANNELKFPSNEVQHVDNFSILGADKGKIKELTIEKSESNYSVTARSDKVVPNSNVGAPTDLDIYHSGVEQLSNIINSSSKKPVVVSLSIRLPLKTEETEEIKILTRYVKMLFKSNPSTASKDDSIGSGSGLVIQSAGIIDFFGKIKYNELSKNNYSYNLSLGKKIKNQEKFSKLIMYTLMFILKNKPYAGFNVKISFNGFNIRIELLIYPKANNGKLPFNPLLAIGPNSEYLDKSLSPLDICKELFSLNGVIHSKFDDITVSNLFNNNTAPQNQPLALPLGETNKKDDEVPKEVKKEDKAPEAVESGEIVNNNLSEANGRNEKPLEYTVVSNNNVNSVNNVNNVNLNHNDNNLVLRENIDNNQMRNNFIAIW